MRRFSSSVFEKNFDVNLILQSSCIAENERIQNENRMKQILRWLRVPPKISSYRVNTLSQNVLAIKELMNQQIVKISENKNIPAPKVSICEYLPEVVLIDNWDVTKLNLEKREKEVMVDVDCGAALLRGAHIFAPGVLGMLSGTKVNDEVSVYVDLNGKCKKGLNKLYTCSEKQFIANGICKMARHHLFRENATPSGIAIEITDTISGCLPLFEDDFLPKGAILLQNIPSIVCIRVLNPIPGDVVLDMCASPGNKTTHIAALLQNKGTLIAIDKTPLKVERLKNNCRDFNAEAFIFQSDSTRIFDETISSHYKDVRTGPPFASESFDKILLDAPCSALGRRPQLACKVKEKVLKSYVPVQKKLFEVAVNLLKPNGRLVYSTCTVTVAENEEIVAWALNKFHCLELVRAEPLVGESAFYVTGLNEKQRSYIQRFGSNNKVDSVGFFIACFVKRQSTNMLL